jgi:hypothetical protein
LLGILVFGFGMPWLWIAIGAVALVVGIVIGSRTGTTYRYRGDGD